MPVTDIATRLVSLADSLRGWLEALARMDVERRLRLARYCDGIADTLARAGEALSSGSTRPARAMRSARRSLEHELGRLAGHGEDVARLMRGQLDAAKLAVLKRRAKSLIELTRSPDALRADPRGMVRLQEAEGYFRSLADRLRT
ncbi:MAG: hypothetical protein GC150_03530 [Rhizobiales bacterium]|nr:hypothetical protein [Hyphomicrobiales bacterium]